MDSDPHSYVRTCVTYMSLSLVNYKTKEFRSVNWTSSVLIHLVTPFDLKTFGHSNKIIL